MIRSPIPTAQPQPTTQHTLALAAFHAQADRRARYLAALALVREIDDALEQHTFHYRRRDGRLMRTLDEVVRAVEAKEWPG